MQTYKDFCDSEAESLGLPVEWIEGATYTSRPGQYTYYGKGFLDILILLSVQNELGVLNFSNIRFEVRKLDYLMDKQEIWEKYIFAEDSTNQSESKLSTIENNRKLTTVDRLTQFYYIKASQLKSCGNIDNSTLDKITKNDNMYLYIPKNKPYLNSCILDWENQKALCSELPSQCKKSGTTIYYVDYNKTDIESCNRDGGRKAVHEYLPQVMVTRAKRKAYLEDAFHSSATFMLKACKIKNKILAYEDIFKSEAEYLQEEENILLIKKKEMLSSPATE